MELTNSPIYNTNDPRLVRLNLDIGKEPTNRDKIINHNIRHKITGINKRTN